MRTACRLVQLVSLIVPPVAIFAQLSNAISLGQMLVATVFAVALFWLARLLEGHLGGP